VCCCSVQCAVAICCSVLLQRGWLLDDVVVGCSVLLQCVLCCCNVLRCVVAAQMASG